MKSKNLPVADMGRIFFNEPIIYGNPLVAVNYVGELNPPKHIFFEAASLA